MPRFPTTPDPSVEDDEPPPQPLYVSSRSTRRLGTVWRQLSASNFHVVVGQRQDGAIALGAVARRMVVHRVRVSPDRGASYVEGLSGSFVGSSAGLPKFVAPEFVAFTRLRGQVVARLEPSSWHPVYDWTRLDPVGLELCVFDDDDATRQLDTLAGVMGFDRDNTTIAPGAGWRNYGWPS